MNHQDLALEESDDDSIQPIKRKKLQQHETGETTTVHDQPSVAIRSRGSEKPLPDPFPLPLNFRSDVEVALRTGRMTRETNKAFFSSVAGCMLSFKRYPMKEEFIRIATDIIRKYPFMRSQTGSPTVSTYLYIYLLELIVTIVVGLSERNWLMFVLALSKLLLHL